jgi:hypothetical protein
MLSSGATFVARTRFLTGSAVEWVALDHWKRVGRDGEGAGSGKREEGRGRGRGKSLAPVTHLRVRGESRGGEKARQARR